MKTLYFKPSGIVLQLRYDHPEIAIGTNQFYVIKYQSIKHMSTFSYISRNVLIFLMNHFYFI